MAAGRFAPSPTGDLHLGNLRTAVLAWLWSRQAGDRFVLRMEDLDRVTSKRELEERQARDLTAIGLDWDGPVLRQSERFDRYATAIDELDRAGRLYPCFCTRKEIAAAASAPNHPAPSGYPGTCRELTAARRHELEASGRPPALRLRSGDEPVEFDDEVLGPTVLPAEDIVVRRNDGVAAYHLAVVVDDAAQGVGIVVRGDDLATSTPGQILLQRRLGLPTPRYAHVPLVLSPTGARLAKRDGSVTLDDRRALGDRPIDVSRWLLATSGQRAVDAATPAATLAAAAEHFDAAALPRTPVRVSDDLLHHSLPSAR